MLDNYDAQFRVRALVPDFDSYLDRYRALSAETRRLVRHSMDCAYGSSSLETSTSFCHRQKENHRAVHVFFHGGYWRAFRQNPSIIRGAPDYRYGTRCRHRNYGLMRQVTMADLLEQCRSGYSLGSQQCRSFWWGSRPHQRFGHPQGAISPASCTLCRGRTTTAARHH